MTGRAGMAGIPMLDVSMAGDDDSSCDTGRAGVVSPPGGGSGAVTLPGGLDRDRGHGRRDDRAGVPHRPFSAVRTSRFPAMILLMDT